MEQEFFHTLERYERHGLDLFVEHAREYLAGQRTVPVSQSNDLPGCQQVLFTFSDELLRRFVEEIGSVKKPYEVALKYGLRGHSNGGVNGILFQNDRDEKMLEATDRLVERNQQQVLEDLAVSEGELGGLERVKIVWHNPSGERIAGVYDSKKGRVIFLGFAKY